MENFKFFNHRICEFFPCHHVENDEDFNCLFCYCPLYALGDRCGGSFKYTDEGIKDCSGCLIPHRKNSYDYIMSKWALINDLAKK